jgi:tRNA(Ile)-lysidine synthase
VLALHVHHGLSEHADAWLAHCAATCRRWARRGLPVEFASRRLVGRPRPAESVEAWARSARYRALRQMAVEGGTDLVLLGHHRRDQAETFLLQSLRGAGVAALASMPRVVRRDGIVWARPWLAQPREAIEAYARQHRLRWIDDDSNDHDRFARNRLRLHVWPALVAAFPDAEAALAGTAERAAHAATLIGECGAEDAAAIAAGDGFDLVRWRLLSPARQRQSLVAWLRREFAEPAPATLVERLLQEATPERHRRWLFAGGELRSYRGRLQRTLVTTAPEEPEPLVFDLSRPGVHAVSPWRGAFRVEHVDRGGIAAADATRLVLRARAPGDRFQAGPRRPARSLKLQYQALGIAPALRRGPIVCRRDGTAVFVPGLGVDARALAADGEPQVSLAWLPDHDRHRERSAEGAR